jgi:hypothetical protein
MPKCNRKCCKGKGLPPLSAAYLRHLLRSPTFAKLRKHLDWAQDPKNEGNFIDIAAKVYFELYKDDTFRNSDVGLGLFGRGPTIVLGPDPTQFLTSPQTQLKYVLLSVRRSWCSLCSCLFASHAGMPLVKGANATMPSCTPPFVFWTTKLRQTTPPAASPASPTRTLSLMGR